MAINRKTRKYTDINFLFNIHPRTNDLVLRVDEDAVKQSVMNLIKTRPFERPFHPEISSQVYAMLFENFTPITSQVIRKSIEDVINKFEPRVTLLSVLVDEDADNNRLTVTIIFRLNNSENPITVTTFLERAR